MGPGPKAAGGTSRPAQERAADREGRQRRWGLTLVEERRTNRDKASSLLCRGGGGKLAQLFVERPSRNCSSAAKSARDPGRVHGSGVRLVRRVQPSSESHMDDV